MAVNKRRRKKGNISSAALRAEKATSSPAPPVLAALAPEDGTSEGTPSFPVVGVGASAGGLEAFTQLLRALPVDTGAAFVLVQHLSPKHESALAEILSRATLMPVTEVAGEPELEPNHVYVIPPDKNIVIVSGHLRLLTREATGKQHPIDQFFRSLAESQRHMAIGVILSGTATDGTLGLEEIKAEGGITFAQDETAQQQGMPQSAVASGCVDFVLPPAAIAAEIARIGTHPYVVAHPERHPAQAAQRDGSQEKETLAPILRLLRSATNVDFTQYKVNTLLRRVRRRMVLQKKAGLEDYTKHLRANPAEVEALCQDILINVTSFFRDPEMFEVLKTKVVPTLLKKRQRQDPIRVWALGCSTGEEAYSLAMILSEATEASNTTTPVQIFATDISAPAIDRARAGVYSKERLQDLSRERLRRFFVEQHGEFRVAKSIRDLCVFSRHNVMSDPPFSRMDLVSCRNLLIYLEPSLQQRIIPVLHYALKPTGFLVLGASETVGRFSDLFVVGDSKHKIFLKKPGSGRLPPLPLRRVRPDAASTSAPNTGRVSATAAEATLMASPGSTDVLKEADRLLASLAPPAVLVDGNFEILQFRGNIEPYLAPAQGKASLALLKMAREGLLVPLQALLLRAKKENALVREEGLRIRSNRGQREVTLEVHPIKRGSAHESCFLVLFKDAIPAQEPRAKAEKGTGRPKAKPGDALLEASKANCARLERELARTREHLQALLEQHEAANEELQSSNEEAQSANEELQSINEELETSKEEIQSSNEELTTVNDELNNRNLEVSLLNNDLTNLIASVQLAIIIVGRDLRIRRFSPAAEKLLNVIPGDVGRPITDIRMNLVLPELDSLLGEVIDTVSPKEREVKDKQGHWWSLRMRPYLTLDSKIDGAVLMLVDIAALKASEQEIAAARDYLKKWEYIFNHAHWAVATEHPETGALELINPAFAEMHGYTVAELIGRPLSDTVAPESQKHLLEHARQAHEQGDYVYESIHIRKDNTRFVALTHVTALKDESGNVLYRAATFQDITERKRLEEDLRKRNEELAAADKAKNQFIAVLSHELRSPLNIIRLWSQILQRPGRSEVNLRKGLDIIERSSKAQAQLIEDLLDVHRISSGSVRLTLAEVDLVEITCSVVDSMSPEAAEKEIHLDREIEHSPVTVSGDSTRLHQVLGNLLGNAIKFTPRGGEIRVTLRCRGARAELSVSDTGQGITAAAVPHIFERFRQPDPLGPGLGLGLSISKRLVELHGGTISVHSPGAGKGATFTVSLPLLALDPARPPVLAGVAAEERSVTLDGRLVLVVDDELDARELLREVLEAAGARTVGVASAEEALAAILQQPPDVIVSDIGMPGRDGYDLVRSIRALPAARGRIPAIALTAYVASEDRARALSAGFQTHMAKPVEAPELIAAIAALTPEHERRRADKLNRQK